jgi:hypothetical protein
MILVNDPYDLVPELFESFPEFSKSLESDVDVLPAVCRESFQLSKKLTIFIQPEPQITQIDQLYNKQIAARPNAVWAVSGHEKSGQWQLSQWFEYFANLTMTVRVNPELPMLDIGHKPWLATALLGGWMYTRGQLLHGLKQQGLIDQCLINYHERSADSADRRNQLRRQYPDLYFNARTPALDQLDDPVFQQIAFNSKICNEYQLISMNTCRQLPGMMQHQHGWISQLVPRNIYNSAYISIIAETEVMTLPDAFFISEKITRPLLVGHPFVVFGCTGYLQCLRDLGFQTFSPWLDESYDLVTDTNKRIASIVDSVEQFSQLNDSQRQQACAEMQPAVEHNRRLVKDQRWALGPIADAIKQYLDLKPAQELFNPSHGC